jgi:Cu/Ag efflux pump CusA
MPAAAACSCARARARSGTASHRPGGRAGWRPRASRAGPPSSRQGPPSLALGETERAEHELARRLAGVPGVVSATGRIGRSRGLGEDIFPPSAGEIDVALAPSASAAAVARAVRARLAAVPGFTFAVRPVLVERIGELVAGEKAPIAVTLFGPDLDELARLAATVTDRLAATPGLVDVHPQTPATQPEVEVRLRQAALARLGLDAAAATAAVQTSLWGQTVGETWQGTAVVPIRVLGPAALHASLAAIRRTPVAFPGGVAPLAAVADVAAVQAPTTIAHQGGLRVTTVVADAAAGQGLASATAQARAALAAVRLPPGTSAVVVGQWQEARAAYLRLLEVGLFALAGIFILLEVAFGSFRAALIVLVNVPLALVGGVAALLLTGAGGGSGIEAPLAVVVLGGLVTSTLLNLVVVPALYLRFGRGAAPAAPPARPDELTVVRQLRAEE